MTRTASKVRTVGKDGSYGTGRQGMKRRSLSVQRNSIGKPALRRLARRAGVKRINAGVYDEAPLALRKWLSTMIHDAVAYAENARRCTVMVNDVLLALKRNGVTLYGYAFTEKRQRLTKPIPASRLAAAAARVAIRARTPPLEEDHEEIVIAEKTPEPVTSKRKVVKKRTPQSERPQAPITPVNPEGSNVRVTPERAQEIQSALSAFRDSVIARQASSDAPIPKVVEWVSAHLSGRGKAMCTEAEVDVVLEALSERDAIMITEDEGHGFRTVWFI